MEGLDDIISGIRESRTQSNIRDIGHDWDAIPPQRYLGLMLSSTEDVSSKEYVINFDPVESAYLHSMVTEETLDKRIIMDKGCFFKGLVFVDYAMQFMFDDRRLLDDLYTLAKNLERRDRSLDPDLEQVARLTGMHYMSHAGKEMLSGLQRDESRWRHGGVVSLPGYLSSRKISPLYEALGDMVYRQLSDDAVKENVLSVRGRDDIRSLIFIDVVLDVVNDEEQRGLIYQRLEESYVQAAGVAMAGLAMESFKQNMSARFGGSGHSGNPGPADTRGSGNEPGRGTHDVRGSSGSGRRNPYIRIRNGREKQRYDGRNGG